MISLSSAATEEMFAAKAADTSVRKAWLRLCVVTLVHLYRTVTRRPQRGGWTGVCSRLFILISVRLCSWKILDAWFKAKILSPVSVRSLLNLYHSIRFVVCKH
jgi:hypothetical protein